ncbi:MAG: HAMP domain-containing histidine kinase [Hyphomonadaceae bacterium]|nr:HAMP domain-containing histidine kinase [Hyphomonadaceae bacterium]
MALACWFWLAGVVIAALLAFANGGARADIAAAVALATAPALTGFILIPRLEANWACLGWLGVWLTSLTGLVAGSGGAESPLAAGLLIVPALASTFRPRWVWLGAVAIGLAYGFAAYTQRFDAMALGPFAVVLTVVSMLLTAGLMTLGRRKPSREAAMTQRIAEVSHELRTPLTHILGFSEMIERQIFGEVGARNVEYAGLIRKSGTHLLGLVNDLLDLSKIEAGRYELELETFDVRAVVDEVVRLSTNGAEKKKIALGMITPEAPLMVRADQRALKRMLINTVGNAIKFTPEGGQVFVTAAAVDGELNLDTSDTGPGIPEAERGTLGQAYERGSGGAHAEGTGLGLSLVRAMAHLHGGTLSFHDAPGGGALVRIRISVLAS